MSKSTTPRAGALGHGRWRLRLPLVLLLTVTVTSLLGSGHGAGSRTAREIRDAILGDLANFKGDQEQADDITVVVVRVR